MNRARGSSIGVGLKGFFEVSFSRFFFKGGGRFFWVMGLSDTQKRGRGLLGREFMGFDAWVMTQRDMGVRRNERFDACFLSCSSLRWFVIGGRCFLAYKNIPRIAVRSEVSTLSDLFKTRRYYLCFFFHSWGETDGSRDPFGARRGGGSPNPLPLPPENFCRYLELTSRYFLEAGGGSNHPLSGPSLISHKAFEIPKLSIFGI